MSISDRDSFLHGTYSLAGRDSAEKYNIFVEFNKLKEKSKNKYKNFFSPDVKWENNKDEDEEIDDEKIQKECKLNILDIKNNIKFSLDYIKQKQKEKEKKSQQKKNLKKLNYNKIKIKNIKSYKTKNNNNLFRKLYQSFKYKYHNIHMAKIEKYRKQGIIQKMNIQQEPIYNPNMDYIYQKLSLGPPWSKLSGRGKKLFQEENYITHLSYNVPSSSLKNIKGFIDMKKQTQRNGFPKNGDIRQRCEKKFVPLNYRIKNEKSRVQSDELGKFYKTAIMEKTYGPPFNFTIIPYNKKNYFKSLYNEDRNTLNDKNRNNSKRSLNTCKSVPDFKSYLSREKLNNLFKKKGKITNGVLSPNYKSIEGRVKMMVIYSKNHQKIKNNPKEFKGMSSDEIYNVNETFEKIYGNKIRAVPIFQKMTSRTNYNKLPFFMNGLSNRMIYYMYTDKTLKMNNYSNSIIYNVRNEIKENKNRFKNPLLNAIRKSLAFDNKNNYDKNRIKEELEIKSKKFNDLIINNNL